MNAGKKGLKAPKLRVPKEGEMLIFRPYITVNGKRIYAWERGIKAFPLIVPKDPPPHDLN